MRFIFTFLGNGKVEYQRIIVECHQSPQQQSGHPAPWVICQIIFQTMANVCNARVFHCRCCEEISPGNNAILGAVKGIITGWPKDTTRARNQSVF
jgi:hypothetical protein